MAPDVKKTVKDSVFRDLFQIPKYSLEIYQELHPDDKDVTEDDIDNVTIENILTDQMYNDLGMVVRGMLIILIEAQSTWTMNIIIRILLYLAHSWNRYIEDTKQNRYGSTKLKLPKPEFYVIYTGERREHQRLISLSEEFFNGCSEFLEVNVHVLYGDESEKGIIKQYVDFTKVYNDQLKIYGRTKKAVLETIRICRDKDILKEYLDGREKEVIDIMTSLFDQEKAVEMYGYERERKGHAEGRAEGRVEGHTEERRRNIKTLSKFLSIEQIAQYLDMPVEEVSFSIEGLDD